jgi:hypothetical protein
VQGARSFQHVGRRRHLDVRGKDHVSVFDGRLRFRNHSLLAVEAIGSGREKGGESVLGLIVRDCPVFERSAKVHCVRASSILDGAAAWMLVANALSMFDGRQRSKCPCRKGDWREKRVRW